MGKVKQWSVEKKDAIETMLINMWASLGMDIPNNYEDIVQDCYEDVCETADPENWHSGDVAIAFRRWIEKQNVRPLPMSEPKSAEDVSIGETIYRMAELRYLIEGLDDDDQICIETIDLETGDTQDLYPMYVDVIENVRLTDGSIVREVRFCQRPNVQQEGEPEFDNDYFKIVHRGWCKASQREEIQIHAGQHGNIFLYQDGDKLGFIIDVYGENDIADTMTVWEDDLNPEEETYAPENFSMVEIEDFKDEWGQFHDEICAELDVPDSNDADDILMVDYFWLPTDNKWIPKCASTYSERQQAIADFLRV